MEKDGFEDYRETFLLDRGEKITLQVTLLEIPVEEPEPPPVIEEPEPEADEPEEVRRAAAELGYRPNVLARSLITGQSRIIGLVVAYLDNQFYPDALERLSNALQAQGYHVLVFMSSPTVGDVQDVITTAIGGMNVSETVEGLERYPINIRYPRELRDNVAALAEVVVPTPSGAQIPLGQLATLRIRQGPPMIKTEGARPNAWVYVDLKGSDVGSWIARAIASLPVPDSPVISTELLVGATWST